MSPQETRERQRLVEVALSWVGTPYHSHGRVKGPQGAVDCGYLLADTFLEAGLIERIPDLEYAPDWHLHRSEERYLAWVARHARRIPGPALPGDIILYRCGRTWSHGAIVVAWPEIVHAVVNSHVLKGNAEQMLLSGHWLRNSAFYRLNRWAN